ncbi:MAG: EAL domain-containing protein [Firmicutes bacterium]|uniref:EAL domain-containing protein n=1 Tax=Sulfobacillus benefaciens TaxID=453960 RepID=A0A2T2X5D0_9FIRM|nr:EAL domain-containing protein [Bacillota bacterium]PSR29710.1 MAG: hypothetical protein C7B43_07935 [Sulfobacillus benefaciens]
MGTRLWAALQPVVNLHTGMVVAHEALLRGEPGSSWESPAALFAIAKRIGQRANLEVMARKVGLSRLPDLPMDQNLFLNVDNLKSDIPAMPGHSHVDSHRVVLEISERRPILTNPELIRQVAIWRSQGHAIALDDYGAGYMGTGAILELHPDILKVDRMLITGVDHDPRRQIVLKSVVQMCDELNIMLVAEGVETLQEFFILKEFGITYGQGFLLGRPQKTPQLQSFAALFHQNSVQKDVMKS